MSERELSKELAAMAAIEQALADLPEDECARVLTWAGSRFKVQLGASKTKLNAEREEQDEEEGDADSTAAKSLAEFYDQASPTSSGESVLVAGYWCQYREGAHELDAQTLNAQLKHLGHGVSNVTRALEWLKSQKPALMVQKRKEGSTKQARKKFAVTNEGKKYIEKMVSKRADGA